LTIKHCFLNSSEVENKKLAVFQITNLFNELKVMFKEHHTIPSNQIADQKRNQLKRRKFFCNFFSA